MPADEAEELHGAGAGGGEPVRGAGVEFGGLAGLEREVVLSEDEAEGAVQDVDPVVALVGAEVRLGIVTAGGEHEFVGLDTTRSAGQRQDDGAVGAGDGPEHDAGVAGGRGVHEVVEGDSVEAREREQLLKGRTAESGFEAREGARRDAGFAGEFGEGDVATLPKALQPWAYCF